MNIYIVTLFPEMFNGVLGESIIKRSQEKKLVNIQVLNLRDWASDKHKTVDDIPYGGGAGMIMKVDVIDKAIQQIKLQISKSKLQTNYKSKSVNNKTRILLTSPKGERYDQDKARSLSSYSNLIIICGHYGGVDARVNELVNEVVSIGDFVLTGGEIPAMAITDSVVRLVEGVITKESLDNETHSEIGKNQFTQYTRPREYTPKSIKKKTLLVPEVLLSGNHRKINEWRKNAN